MHCQADTPNTMSALHDLSWYSYQKVKLKGGRHGKYQYISVSRFVETFVGQRVFVGVDVHKRTFSVALLRPDGMIKDWSNPADVALLSQVLFSASCRDRDGLLQGRANRLRLGAKPKVGWDQSDRRRSSRIPRHVSPTNKTDSLDCRKLAEYAASGLIRSIAIPSEKEEAFPSLQRRRHQLTDSLQKTKQSIRALLLSLGMTEPHNLNH